MARRPALGVVLAFGVIAVLRSIQVGVPFRDPHTAFLGTRLALPQARYATASLGWHFAVDVPAGMAIAALAWLLGLWTVGVRQRPRRFREVGPEHATHGFVGSGTR